MKARLVFHVAAVVVLAVAVAAAQSPTDKQKTAESNQTHSREASVPSVSERETGTGIATGKRQHQPTITARETGSGMATGRMDAVLNQESGQPSVPEAGITARETGRGMATGKQAAQFNPREYSRNSAHATESLPVDGESKHAGQMSQAQSNPMYKGSGAEGTNPLYQGKDKSAAPPASGNGSKPVVEYKDGEDGVSHTRPGNHKPGKMN